MQNELRLLLRLVDRLLRLIRSLPRTFVRVRAFEAGSSLFSAPITGRAERRFCGVTRWPVDIYYVGPEPLTERIHWDVWGRHVFRP